MSDCRITGRVEVALGRIIKSSLYDNTKSPVELLPGSSDNMNTDDLIRLSDSQLKDSTLNVVNKLSKKIPQFHASVCNFPYNHLFSLFREQTFDLCYVNLSRVECIWVLTFFEWIDLIRKT